jgi:Zn ribbon nucleic-acid-binding protein
MKAPKFKVQCPNCRETYVRAGWASNILQHKVCQSCGQKKGFRKDRRS